MKALKKYTIWSIAIALAFSVTSCASYSDLPGDDIYYSKKTSNPGEYNWEDFQKNAQSYGSNTSGNNSGNNGEFDYSSSYEANASGDQMSNGEYDYIDEHYDSDYDSRIKRFNDGGSDRGYYDDYYTGGSSCGCGSGSSFSMSFGMGMGYGYGYPYYGYGYPYYGYPYYGSYYSSSYWNGYWNGYYDGLYGGGYYPGYGGGYYPGNGGGYYPDYGAPYVAYGPRGSKTGGSTIPKSRGGRTAGGPGDDGSKSGVVVAGRGVAHGNPATTTAVASTSVKRSKPIEQRPANAVRVRENQPATPGPITVASRQEKMKKPAARTSQKPAPRYQKPKSYQSLPSRQPRSSKEYVRPATMPRATTTAKSSTNPYTRTRKPATTTRSTNTRSATSSTRSNSYRPSKSYSSPSRSSSSSPSRSYSSPTRSRSSSSPSRSSGSSSGSSRSSSSSRGGGGIRR